MPLVVFFGFTNCVLLYDNKRNTRMPVTIGILFNNILTLGILRSVISHFPGCFCPWTFFQNIGFNMVQSDPFMTHLGTQLGYYTGEFQALQLIVLAAFGVVNQQLVSCMLVHFWKSTFKQQLGCRFDISDCNSSLLYWYFDICNCIYLNTSYDFLVLHLHLE